MSCDKKDPTKYVSTKHATNSNCRYRMNWYIENVYSGLICGGVSQTTN